LRIALENRTQLFDNREVKGSEFLRKVKSIAKRKKLAYRWSPERGVGSHDTVYLGGRFTVVKDLKNEFGPRSARLLEERNLMYLSQVLRSQFGLIDPRVDLLFEFIETAP
jgi:mRNA interferase HicA